MNDNSEKILEGFTKEQLIEALKTKHKAEVDDININMRIKLANLIFWIIEEKETENLKLLPDLLEKYRFFLSY